MDWLQIVLGFLGAVGAVFIVNILKWLFKRLGITVESVWAMVVTYVVCILVTILVLFITKTIPISIVSVVKYSFAIVGVATGLYKIIWPMLINAINMVSKKIK